MPESNPSSRSLDAHHRLIIGVSTAALALAVTTGRLTGGIQAIVTWNVFALTLLLLAWRGIMVANPADVVRSAKLQDSSRWLIFVFVVCAALTSVLALGFLLGTAKGLAGTRLAEHVVLAVSTILSSWALVHTVFTLRYAHLYYRPADEKTSEKRGTGLKFPGGAEPDYLDFAYFSFVVGMTGQVSDVAITSRPIRRLALLHGVIAFLFNTVIVALTINLISGLL